MDVIQVPSADDYSGRDQNQSKKSIQSQMSTPQKRGRRPTDDVAILPLDNIDAQENIRASISSGVGVGRVKQSRTNLSSRNRGIRTKINSPDSQKASPKGNLFK